MNHHSPTTRLRHTRPLPFIVVALFFTTACEPEIIGVFRGPAAAQRVPLADAARPTRAPTAGDPCETSADCAPIPGATCLAWSHGYCTGPCEPDGACLEGICVDPGLPALPGARCLRECADDDECRAGYTCRATVDGLVCVPRD
jgi:hypothetical protein